MRNTILPRPALCFLVLLPLLSSQPVSGNVIVSPDSLTSSSSSPVLVVHGGAGSLAPQYYQGKLDGMKAAVRAGHRVLTQSGNVLDAVEAAIKVMEDDPNFNAGRGSKLNIFGEVEMDASIMDGSSLKVGAVASVGGLRHPVTAARAVMENTSHVLLVSSGAERMAGRWGLEQAGEDWLVTQHSRDLLEEFLAEHNITHLRGQQRWQADCLGQQAGSGTVGAVAYYGGTLAAATSTGGITGKLPGGVGDSPLVGHGVLADDQRSDLNSQNMSLNLTLSVRV